MVDKSKVGVLTPKSLVSSLVPGIKTYRNCSFCCHSCFRFRLDISMEISSLCFNFECFLLYHLVIVWQCTHFIVLFMPFLCLNCSHLPVKVCTAHSGAMFFICSTFKSVVSGTDSIPWPFLLSLVSGYISLNCQVSYCIILTQLLSICLHIYQFSHPLLLIISPINCPSFY